MNPDALSVTRDILLVLNQEIDVLRTITVGQTSRIEQLEEKLRDWTPPRPYAPDAPLPRAVLREIIVQPSITEK